MNNVTRSIVMNTFKMTLATSLIVMTAAFTGSAMADEPERSRSGGATITTDSGKTYDVDHQASTDGNGNYKKSTSVNGKEIRSVEGGHGSRTIKRPNGGRTVTRN
jgi:hypothetical protein